MGHEAYGTYFALFALGFLFLAVADLGVNQFVTKAVAGNPEQLRGQLPGYFRLKIGLSLVYPLFMLGAGAALGYGKTELGYLLIISATHSLAQLIAFFRGGLQAFQHFRLDAVASVLDRIFLIGMVLFLLSRQITLDNYIIACFLSSVLSLVIVYFMLVKQIGVLLPSKGEKSWREMLRLSLPFAILTVLYSINDKVDQVMLERMYSRQEAGLYGAAYRWVDAVMMYLWTVLPIFFARFAHHIRSRSEQSALLRLGQGIAAVPMIFCSVFVFFYGEKLLWQFHSSTAAEIATMTYCLRVLFIAVTVNGIFAVYSTLLTSTGHEKFVGWAITGSIALNIGLNAFLIPRYGALACAWDTVASFSTLSVAYVIYIAVRREVRVPWDLLLRLGIAGGLFTAAFYGLSRTAMEWWLVSLLAGAVLALLTLMLRIIPIR